MNICNRILLSLFLLGYLGPSCEEKVDHCASFPCQNNGTCYADRLSFTCSCSPGYTGPTCAQLIDFCALNPCAHGICRSVGTSYKCLCIPGVYVPATFCQTLLVLTKGLIKITSFSFFSICRLTRLCFQHIISAPKQSVLNQNFQNGHANCFPYGLCHFRVMHSCFLML